MMASDTVTLWEDNAGGLYLHKGDAPTVYEVTDVQEQGSFESDAVALLDGDTDDWTVPTFDATPAFFEGLRYVVEYDGVTGAIRVRDHAGNMVHVDAIDHVDLLGMGHAARQYLPYPYHPATTVGVN